MGWQFSSQVDLKKARRGWGLLLPFISALCAKDARLTDL